MNTLKWANGSITRREELVGPRHDPYHRETYTITIGKVEFKLIECALAGTSLQRNGVTLETLELSTSDEDFDNTLKAYTGFGLKFWTSRLWATVYRRRHAADPEGYEMAEAMENALWRHM